MLGRLTGAMRKLRAASCRHDCWILSKKLTSDNVLGTLTKLSFLENRSVIHSAAHLLSHFSFGQGGPYGQATLAGCTLGKSRCRNAGAASQAEGRPSHRARPQLLAGHTLRAQDGHALGISAPGARLRLRHDLLAAAARLATSRRLGPHLASASGRAWHGRRHRLVEWRSRQLLGARCFWGAQTGPNPTDRGKAGSKRHLITDQNGTPLAIAHTGANVHDSQMAMPLVKSIPPIKGPSGRPRRRPNTLLADAAYYAKDKILRPLRALGIIPGIPERGRE